MNGHIVSKNYPNVISTSETVDCVYVIKPPLNGHTHYILTFDEFSYNNLRDIKVKYQWISLQFKISAKPTSTQNYYIFWIFPHLDCTIIK